MPTTANFIWVINAIQLKLEFDRINAIPGVPAGKVDWFITMDRDEIGEVQLSGFFFARVDGTEHCFKSSAITKDIILPTTSQVSLNTPYVLGSIYLQPSDLVQIKRDGINIPITPMKKTFTWPQTPPPPPPPPPSTIALPVDMLYYTCNIGPAKAPRQLYPSPPATGSF